MFQWRDLLSGWTPLDNAELLTWRKKCELFEAFVEKVDSNKFLFSIDITDAGRELCTQPLKATSSSQAFEEADRLIFEFLAIGVEMLGGIKLTMDRPPNEIRIKQICVDDQHIIYGVSEDGLLYRKEEINDPQLHGAKKVVWSAISMERHQPKER